MKTLSLLLALTSAALAVTAPENTPFQVQVTGKGRPAIFIPGLSSSGETWDTTVARYKDRFECHVLTVAGFAGVPRVPGPVLEQVRDGLAAYIRKNKLDRPAIVGHSLGGYLALDFAAKYPDLAGRIVIVDAYPFYAGLANPNATAEEARANGEMIRKAIASQPRDQYDRYVKSGVATRPMVEKESDFERLVEWGLKSDPSAVGDAMAELYSGDLRAELPKIKCPALVLAEWASFAQYSDRAKTESNLKLQYAKLAGVEIHINDKARHFIMWDDPEWMFGHLDSFLNPRKMKRHAYWICQVLGWASYSLLGAVASAAQVGWTAEVGWGYGLYFGYSILLTHLLRRFVKGRGWLDRPAYLPLFAAAWITGLIQAALVLGVSTVLTPHSAFRRPATALPMAIGVSLVTIGWMTLYVAATSGRRAREKQLALRNAELRALEAQINPHFLFNCLNSIRGLVLENPPLAQDLITRLANILRYNLHRDAGHTVPLSSEMEAAADYLAIEKARFEDRLRVCIDVSPQAAAAPVPPMLVQTLVENAVKHGIAPRTEGGDVSVHAAIDGDGLTIRVENPGRLAQRNGGSPPLGLHNIRERLRLLYGERASLDLVDRDADRVAAIVRIPHEP